MAALLFCAVATGQVQPYYFNTIAGGPSGTLSPCGSADGTNSDAQFCTPYGTAADGQGQVYVADSGNDTIRKLTRSGTNWVVTTIAGLAGNPGYTDGTNSDARFHTPSAIAIDPFGVLYVADMANNTIRRMAPVGTNWVVTTIAGLAGFGGNVDGTNNTALFAGPCSVTLDAAGALYVADFNNFSIRKVTPLGTTWVVSTIATFGQELDVPPDGGGYTDYHSTAMAVTADRLGNLFVANQGYSIIQELSPYGTNWTLTTIAGLAGYPGFVDGANSDARFSSPVGIVVDDNGIVYVADGAPADSIRQLAPSGTNWVVTTIAPADVRADLPCGISADPRGDLFVATSETSTILELTPSGTNWVTNRIGGDQPPIVVAPNADGTNVAATFNHPQGIAAANDGSVFLADTSNRSIRKLTPVGSNWVVSTAATVKGLPYGIAVDATGDIYLTDTINSMVQRLQRTGTNWVETLVAGNESISGHADGTNGSATFNAPAGIAVDGSGALYVADSGNNLIRKIQPIGTNWVVSTIAGSFFNGLWSLGGSADGSNRNAQFSRPWGVVVDSSGNLFVADFYNSTIRKLTPMGTNWVVTTIAGRAGTKGAIDGTNNNALLDLPSSIAVDTSGNLYVGGAYNSTIRKITPMGTNWVVTTIGGLAGVLDHADGLGSEARFESIVGLTVGGDGSLFALDADYNDVRLGQSRPALSIVRGSSGVVLSWPAWGAGFVLETRDASASQTVWSPLAGASEGPGGFTLANPAGGAGAIFRLRWPSSP